MHKPYYNLDESRSVLATLRSVIPDRPLRFSEALRIAELQASRLLELTGVTEPAVPSELISELPRISVQHRDLPTSGLNYWNGQVWIIALNRSEPWTRQRFTLFHEYKHIIDHGRSEHMYSTGGGYTAEQRAEQAADYFAGCALMPKRLLKQAWASGLQRPTALAAHFDVSSLAVAVRLAQIGLTDRRDRCTQRRYHRQATPTNIHTTIPTPIVTAVKAAA